MNISRFFGSTNREALRQVRLALGPEALIVSNRRVNGGVEILATDPTSVPVNAQAAASPSVAEGPASVSPNLAPRPAAATPRPSPAAPGVEVMSAIGEMRGALENRIDELVWGNELRRAPQAASLFQILLGLGFSTALLRAMLKRLPQDLSAKAAFEWARRELTTHLPVLQSEEALWQPGQAIALVGPTGVGKTTTIAKLAARCVRRSGPDSLVLITTDTYRIGAHEQLKIYGQMLRVPVHVVQDVRALRGVMQGIRPDQSILVDNVGISQRDRYVAEQAAMLAGAGRALNRLLVLNASSHGDTLDEVARNYVNDGGSPLAGCIVSKIDEAIRLGAALDTAIRYRLPIHYVSNGQKVPENLLFPNAADLVDQALAHEHQASALYAPTEADFAALMSLNRVAEAPAEAAVDENRRMRLLPGLLSMANSRGATLSIADFETACAYVDDTVCAAEAYDLWRGETDDGADAAPLSHRLKHLARVSGNEYSHDGGDFLLALHDHAALGSGTGARGRLWASLLMTQRGRALASPLQQLSLAEGWMSSCGAAAQVPPSAAEALYHQVQSLAVQHPQWPLIHLFEGGSQALWRRLNELNVNWLSQVGGKTRVQVEGCPTTVAAVAKTLQHHPVGDAAALPRLALIDGLPIDDVVVWVASEVVEVHARQQPVMRLRLVSVRIVSRHDGHTVKAFCGFANLLAETPATAWLASWLLIRAEARQSLRHAARLWPTMSSRSGLESLQKRALAATQSGLAAWQMMQDDHAAIARQVAASLLGRAALAPSTTAVAMLKLFALKEMVGT